MSIEELQHICKQFKGVTQDIKWESHLCFNVGQKMFLVTLPDGFPHTASFKTTNEYFEELCNREGIIPAPYLARHQWVRLDDINRLSRIEWEKYIRISYELVYDKLPSKLKKEIV